MGDSSEWQEKIMAKLNSLTYTYLQQGGIYHSDSHGKWVDVAKMHPTHARNAALKLIREAEVWAEEAGVSTASPVLWMTVQPLFVALVDRAGFR
jgi:hypothetical protein